MRYYKQKTRITLVLAIQTTRRYTKSKSNTTQHTFEQMHPRTHTFTLTHITSVNCSNLKINQGWRGAEGATVRWGGGGGRVAKPLLAVVGFEQSI